MKNLKKELVGAFLIVAAFVVLLGWASDYDYCEQIILHMSQEEYDSVKNRLTQMNGESPSEREIAHWWADHHHK